MLDAQPGNGRDRGHQLTSSQATSGRCTCDANWARMIRGNIELNKRLEEGLHAEYDTEEAHARIEDRNTNILRARAPERSRGKLFTCTASGQYLRWDGSPTTEARLRCKGAQNAMDQFSQLWSSKVVSLLEISARSNRNLRPRRRGVQRHDRETARVIRPNTKFSHDPTMLARRPRRRTNGTD